MRAEINYLGLTVKPLKLSYEFYRDTGKNGKPSTMVLGGIVKTELQADYDTMRFLEEMLSIDERIKNRDLPMPSDSECYKKAVIKIYDSEDHGIRTLELLDTYISHFKEVFETVKRNLENGNTNNYVEIEFRSASQIINKGVAKNVFGWYITNPFEIDEYKSPVQAVEQENATPKIIVDFRPGKDYDGEYGFDHMRDTDKKDSLTYKNILGTNRAKVSGKWIDKFKKYATETKYNSLKDDHYGTIVFPWHKDNKGGEIEYIQSWLTIYPKEKITLSLQIDTMENPKDLNLEYDKTLFKSNTDSVPAQKKGKKRLKDHLIIECLKEFSTDQTIKVMLGSTQFGQLNILANTKAKRKKAQVVFVKVKTELTKGTVEEGNTTNKTGKPEKEMLERYLKQAYIKLELTEEKFDLTLPDPKTKNPKQVQQHQRW